MDETTAFGRLVVRCTYCVKCGDLQPLVHTGTEGLCLACRSLLHPAPVLTPEQETRVRQIVFEAAAHGMMQVSRPAPQLDTLTELRAASRAWLDGLKDNSCVGDHWKCVKERLIAAIHADRAALRGEKDTG